MPYIENRLVHDADSHLMEMSDCLNPYFEKSLLGRFLEHPNLGVARRQQTRHGRSPKATRGRDFSRGSG